MHPSTEAKINAKLTIQAMNQFFFDTNPDTIFVKSILPDTYELIDCDPKSAIRCKSRTGIRHNPILTITSIGDT